MKIMNSFWANGNGGVLRRRVPLIGIVLLVFSGCQSCGNVGTVGNGMEPPQSGIISGTIVITSDASSSLAPGGDNEYRPVADARVRIVGSGQEAVATDDDGNFEIEVAGGEHLLIAEKVDADGEKHMLGTKVTVKNGFTTRLDTPLLLQQAGALVGLVRLADAKEDAHEGILVQLENTDLFALTDEQGSYTLPGVPAGEFVVLASRIGYTTAKSSTIVIEAGKVSTVEDMSLEEDRNAGVEGSVVEGMILDAGSGKGIEAAFVAIKGGGLGAVSNDEGQYKIWLPAGRFDLLAVAPGYESQTREVDTSSGGDGVGNTTLDFELTAEEGDHQAVFEGKILHAVNAVPVASVVVVADPARGQAVSDKDGLFSLSLPEGCYRFTFAKGGFVSRQLTRCGSGGQQIELGSIELTEQVPMCVPEAEVCDNVDNDCNGVVDDGGVCGGSTPPVAPPENFAIYHSKAVAGASSGCILRQNGEIWCSGHNAYGQLGNESLFDSMTPVAVRIAGNADANWSSLSAGLYHQCAIKTDSSMWCWGVAMLGLLGFDPLLPPTLYYRNGRPYTIAPVQVDLPGSGSNNVWASISSSPAHNCAIRTDGSLYCWGKSDYGALGFDPLAGYLLDACVSSPSSKCAQQPLPVLGATKWKKVATGMDSTCAIADDYHLYCWGTNEDAELGVDLTGNPLKTTCNELTKDSASTVTGPHECVRVPVLVSNKTWRDIDSGWYSSCAIDTSDDLYCWGYNGYGGLGITLGQSSCPNGNCQLTPQKMVVLDAAGNAVKWRTVDQGRWSGCAVSQDGDVYCWGQNDYGKVGVPIVAAGSSPGQIVDPTLVLTHTASEKWLDVSANHYHSCARSDLGRTKCWGMQPFGALGTGAATPAPDYKTCTPEMSLPGANFAASICTDVPQLSLY